MSLSLRAFAFGTFHALLVFVVLATLLHAFGSLGDALAQAGSVVGSLAFLLLWSLSLAFTRRAMCWPDGEPAQGSALMTRIVAFGGVTGWLYFLILAFGYAVTVAMQERSPDGFLAVLFYALLISFVAFLVGAVIGLLAATVDLAAQGVANVALRWGEGPMGDTPAEKRGAA